MPRRILIAVAVLALLGAGCSTAAAKKTASTTPPRPAGRYPSAISKMVCADDAQKEIAEALGEKATVTTPTWVNDTYTCRYVYPTGSMTLSVKELSSWSQTLAYFHHVGQTEGVRRNLANLGQGAFQVTNGSVAVRKDWKVLYVDITGLPPQFGKPPTSRGAVAVTVADVILGCWAGD